MALVVQHGIVRVGMRVKAIGQQNDGAQIHRPSPERAQQLALYAHVFDESGIGGSLDGGDGLGQRDLHRRARGRIEVDLDRLAVQVAGLAIPMLPFALVHRELQGTAVRAVESFVDVENRLNVIIAGRHIGERVARVAGRGAIDHATARGGDVGPENLLRRETFVNRLARLRRGGRGQHQEHPAIQGLIPGNFKTGGRFGLRSKGGGQQNQGGNAHDSEYSGGAGVPVRSLAHLPQASASARNSPTIDWAKPR